MKKPLAIVITGPTASGKSALAVSLAKALNTEIISADSRQIYKGIPIVTAVPTQEEREGITHHLIEKLNLEDYYNASMFEQDSLRILGNIFAEKEVAIVCGGSMLYVDALTEGIDDIPTVPENIRSSLMAEWKEKGDAWLLSQLALLDPIHFDKVDRKNMKRVFHAVEVSMTAQAPYSSLLLQKKPERDFDILKIVLDGDRQFLFDKINNRVLNMMEQGLEEEARNVYPFRQLNSLNTVGLKEMFDYFDGKTDRQTAIARIQKNTRVYAKKQTTWHKRDKKAKRLNFHSPLSDNVSNILKMI